jgi:DICT domain-containing protein
MPEFRIDPKFSVYGLVKRSLRDKAVLKHRRTMSVISNEIENATLLDDASNLIFSSFQRLSRFLPQEQRYRQLAAKAKHVYVFGELDVEVPRIANLTYVPLQPSDQLAKEWFIVSFGRDYFSALATQELSHIDDPDSQRMFKGVWSFDVFVVGLLHQWLSSIVNLRTTGLEETHDYLSQAQLISNTMTRISLRLGEKKNSNNLIQTELNKIMQNGLHPAFQSMKATSETETLT